MRLWQLTALVLACLLMVPGTRAAEGEILELQDLPASAEPDYVEFLKKKQEERQKLLKERKDREEALAKTISELASQREKIAKIEEVKATVDEKEFTEKEPRTMEEVLNSVADKPKPDRRVRDAYEISTDDFDIYVHERWSINATDFRLDQPQYITADIRQGSAKRWFGFPFTITNSTLKARRITPVFVAITPKGVLNYSVGGFIPERMLADSLQRPLADSEDPRDKELLGLRVSPVESQIRLTDFIVDPEKYTARQATLQESATFEPGQTRWGGALWSNFSDEFTELKIVVHGLNNAHRYEEKMRRALVLTFARNDDEFNTHRTELKYKSKRWEYLWMWDQGITVPLPGDAKDAQLKIQQVTTPAGASKLMWAFPFTITNTTRASQELAINKVSYALPVAVDIAGAKVPVEVCVVDDGQSSIYKTQVLKALGKDAIKDRYQYAPVDEGSKTQYQRRKFALEPGKATDEVFAVFDEADVDWDNVRLQVETELTRLQDKKALAAQTWERLAKTYRPDDKDLLQKNPGIIYDPRRLLTEEEFAQVKDQVAKAIAGALDAAKAKKAVVAYFDCVAGLSSGTYRISRSYRKPGVVEEGWLTEWDNWMKGYEASDPTNQ